MNSFQYRDNQLFAEEVMLQGVAERFGTPCYVYSRATLENRFEAYRDALGTLPHLICYAVKSNSNIAVLNVLARLGAGFDIVSSGELERVLAAGGDPGKTVFSGVGKTPDEMAHALEAGIYCFNVESEAELDTLNHVAGSVGKVAQVSLRVNPDVDAETHPYISTGLRENKFGVPIQDAPRIYRNAYSMPGIRVVGVDCHIGSQLTSLDPFLDALDRILLLIDTLHRQGIQLQHLDLGGGLGIRYGDETPPSPSLYVRALTEKLRGYDLQLIFEPGRSISAEAGVLLTRVQYLKTGEEKNFAIVDAAMNDLLRPALYEAWMNITPLHDQGEAHSQSHARCWDIVGPVCESADFLGKDRLLDIAPGDYLAVHSAGAYGFSMSSNYNSRNRAAEIMVDGRETHVIRQRESWQDQFRSESLLP